MSIKIKVRLLGIFQHLSGKKFLNLELNEPVTVRIVVENLIDMFTSEFKDILLNSELEDPRPNSLILVQGKEINVLQGLETEIKNDEEIVFVPMVHGG
jgi:molybdopterin synthase sulfur carrier subunit